MTVTMTLPGRTVPMYVSDPDDIKWLEGRGWTRLLSAQKVETAEVQPSVQDVQPKRRGRPPKVSDVADDIR